MLLWCRCSTRLPVLHDIILILITQNTVVSRFDIFYNKNNNNDTISGSRPLYLCTFVGYLSVHKYGAPVKRSPSSSIIHSTRTSAKRTSHITLPYYAIVGQARYHTFTHNIIHNRIYTHTAHVHWHLLTAVVYIF